MFTIYSFGDYGAARIAQFQKSEIRWIGDDFQKLVEAYAAAKQTKYTSISLFSLLYEESLFPATSPAGDVAATILDPFLIIQFLSILCHKYYIIYLHKICNGTTCM